MHDVDDMQMIDDIFDILSNVQITQLLCAEIYYTMY